MTPGNLGQGHLAIPGSYERSLIQSLKYLAKTTTTTTTKTNTMFVSYAFYHFEHLIFKKKMEHFASLELEFTLLWA